jgi:hypothetical protein
VSRRRALKDPVVELSEDISFETGADGFVRIRIPRPDTRIRRFLSFIFRLGDHKILVLDETGTEMFGLINGQRTFKELARHLAGACSLEEDLAEQSMAAFLNRLSHEGVVKYAAKPGE